MQGADVQSHSLSLSEDALIGSMRETPSSARESARSLHAHSARQAEAASLLPAEHSLLEEGLHSTGQTQQSADSAQQPNIQPQQHVKALLLQVLVACLAPLVPSENDVAQGSPVKGHVGATSNRSPVRAVGDELLQAALSPRGLRNDTYTGLCLKILHGYSIAPSSCSSVVLDRDSSAAAATVGTEGSRGSVGPAAARTEGMQIFVSKIGTQLLGQLKQRPEVGHQRQSAGLPVWPACSWSTDILPACLKAPCAQLLGMHVYYLLNHFKLGPTTTPQVPQRPVHGLGAA